MCRCAFHGVLLARRSHKDVLVSPSRGTIPVFGRDSVSMLWSGFMVKVNVLEKDVEKIFQ